MSYPADGKPRFVVATIHGSRILPDGRGANTAQAAYVLDRPWCYTIRAAYHGKNARASAERAAKRLEQQVTGQPPKPIPPKSKMRHGTVSAYNNLRCRCVDCVDATRHYNLGK